MASLSVIRKVRHDRRLVSRKDFLNLVTSGEMPDDASLAACTLLTIWESKNSPAS